MIINPQIITTPDRPQVIIRDPMESVDLEKVLQRVLFSQGWGLGTQFDVHFIDHGKTRVLASCAFLVIEDREEYQTAEVAPMQSLSKTVNIRRFAPLGSWRSFGENETGTALSPGVTLETDWNVGRRVHEVKDAEGEVLGCDPDKDKAEAMARGEIPLAMNEKAEKGKAA